MVTTAVGAILQQLPAQQVTNLPCKERRIVLLQAENLLHNVWRGDVLRLRATYRAFTGTAGRLKERREAAHSFTINTLASKIAP